MVCDNPGRSAVATAETRRGIDLRLSSGGASKLKEALREEDIELEIQSEPDDDGLGRTDTTTTANGSDDEEEDEAEEQRGLLGEVKATSMTDDGAGAFGIFTTRATLATTSAAESEDNVPVAAETAGLFRTSSSAIVNTRTQEHDIATEVADAALHCHVSRPRRALLSTD